MQKKIERTAPKSKVVEHKHQGNIEEKLLIKSQESGLCLGIAEFIKFWQKQTGPKVLPSHQGRHRCFISRYVHPHHQRW